MRAEQIPTSKQSNSEQEGRLDHLARLLAKHQSSLRRNPKQRAQLLTHLDSWNSTLQAAYRYFRATPLKDLTFSRAGEWMLDNFYIIEQTFHQIEEDLPRHFFDQLPKLDATDLKDYPRIFALAWELIEYSHGQLDLTQVTTFIQDYQQVTPLMIGELWALPTMLRIGILNLMARAVSQITGVGAFERLGKQTILPESPSLIDDEAIVANCFLSLRLLSATEWKRFFEQTSLIDQILRQDPSGIYPAMDFDTRNNYRSVIEELSRHSTQSEEMVAKAAVECARKAETEAGASPENPDRKAHIGYYLIDAGLTSLEKQIGYHPGIKSRIRQTVLAHPTFAYLGSIIFISLLIFAGFLSYTYFTGGSISQLMITAILGGGLALEAAINLVHWIITHNIPPRKLPRLDFSKGIPEGYRTMVVIPTLIENATEVDSLLEDLELHYLRNPDPQLTFALLTDFSDAPLEHMPEDEQLLARAKSGVEELNLKYEGSVPFYLFHRERAWNSSERSWMGWERKRGKLVEFNRLVLETGRTSYSTQVGELSILHNIKYVITLDADTSLPQDSASRLIATLAHPLNRAEFITDSRMISKGYTILQPRVEIKPTSANRSRFAQIFAGNTGFDLYTLAVSDVYQDLFGEGSYVGKGIYDVVAFERSLAGQVRENTLLSHDLFEGIYGRAALVTDVILYEEYPARYRDYTRRMRRWIRGDWQLLPWLFPVVQTERGTARNPLSLIDRWKLFDNLRRSLLAPTTLAFFLAAWPILPGSPLLWTILVLLAPAITIAIQTIQHVSLNFRQLSFIKLFETIKLPLIRWVMAVLFIPYEAILDLLAIGVTLIRLLIVRKNLLQWTTAANIANSLRNNRFRIWGEVIASLAFNLFLGFAILMVNPSSLPVATPLLIAWAVSPLVAFWISRSLRHTTTPLSETQRKQLQRLARRTWAYFEQFAGPDDHWLPPDHFQENPRGNVAHYTTPTNIGLFVLSTLSAFDLGYLGLFELAVRLRDTFENVAKLEHYRGHLLNWYDTQTLTPLPPRYVSTVDSGNLAACLIALKQGCLALTSAPLVGDQQWQGLLAILDILGNILQDLERDNPGSNIKGFRSDLVEVYDRIASAQGEPELWTSTLTWFLSNGWYGISRHLIGFLDSAPKNLNQEILNELQLYLDTLHQQLISMQRNLKLLVPWLDRIDQPPRLLSRVGKTSFEAWQEFLDSLPLTIPTLGSAASAFDLIKAALSQLEPRFINGPGSAEDIQEARDWCQCLSQDLSAAKLRAEALLIGFTDLAKQADATVGAMDFRFLFDEQRQVFHIGYNANTEEMDANYYDLLASEARIASLIAIAKGDIPQSHWQHLGRPVTQINGNQVLLSWSGTMFEYLMPALLLRNYPGTFLSDSCYIAINAQKSYALQKHIPWGISESGFYAFDANMNYQYRAFGVPDLGYKRDLPDDSVIAPYASLIGLSLQPQAVLNNIEHLENMKMLGRYGLYEALDFTPARLPPGQEHAIVQSYMAHHQGMILMAACNYLLEDVMVQRFHADKRIQSVELLLQEKVPQNPHIEYPHPEEISGVRLSHRFVVAAPWRVPVDTPIPQVHVLSQGSYRVLITNSGSGYSQWGDLALTRWRADTTLDNWGTWIYIKDLDSGKVWSVTSQPTGSPPEGQEVLYYPHKAEFRSNEQGISSHTEITVGADDIEIRRVTLLNDTDHPRRLMLTSYGEVVLAPQDVDRRHPAFNKIFIESEYLPLENTLLFNRRPRSAEEKEIYLAHTLVVEPGHKVTGGYDSDRSRFLGRGRTVRNPISLEKSDNPLIKATDETLDPIFSLSQEIEIKAHARTQIAFLTLVASSRKDALEQVTHYQSHARINRAFDEARAHGEEELAELGLTSLNIENIQKLLSLLLYPVESLRAVQEVLAENTKGQSGLWAYGISGDYPILSVHVKDGDNPLLLEALQAYSYWRFHKVTVNLVILNDQDTSYAMDLHNQVYRLLVNLGADKWLNQRDGIFLLRSDQVQKVDQVLLETVSGVILDPKKGNLAEHVKCLSDQPIRLPAFTPALAITRDAELTAPLIRPSGMQMDNGLGGFSPDGKEYVMFLQPGQFTPRPWVNVIANPGFGFLVSDSGLGSTWAENSGENRLTPWRNDPVSDPPSEALYLRDEETGLVWSSTPLPAGSDTAFLIRHGAGYSTFESQSHGLNQHLRLFAATDVPLKIAKLRLENLWSRPRRITVTYYAEWVLGTTRDTDQAYIVPEFDPARHALFASNRFNNEFGERVAFLAANKKPHSLTTDRAEFLGRMGSMNSPAGLKRIGLASTVRVGSDPCAAIQLHVDLAPGQVEEVFFLLGEGKDRQESITLIDKYQVQGQIELAWQTVQHMWNDLLEGITVHTPDPGMDLLLNRWLLYQTISCRLWGRSALYQSSGAFGFRDQLQDVMAVLHVRPGLAREQILNAAQHQFEAGDVLHWWHPPSGRGVRTRFSDDLLWLPFVTTEYVNATGDLSILDEKIPFLKGDPLKPDETEHYGQFEKTPESYSLYEHCRRVVEKGITAGIHGLPLMGSGDWNDGMNRVGWKGRGESVWLGWFLHVTLIRFASLCVSMKNDPGLFLKRAENLAAALESNAWDGNWYLRAFYDDGSKLGSSQNDECRIDSIAQSWSVLSGAADLSRAVEAMESVDRLLVRKADHLLLLLAPPFDKTPHDPGYIKGYPPGVRENGGQYTHAAIWAAWAFARLGQGDRASALFRLLNPIYHADTPYKAAQYKVEPYGIAADIYSQIPYTGTGGWTWYTGSAAWMYRLGIEAILGISRAGNSLIIDPCIPTGWPGFELIYRFGTTPYRIHVENPESVNRGVSQIWLNGILLTDNRIPLTDDARQHEVRVIMGEPVPEAEKQK